MIQPLDIAFPDSPYLMLHSLSHMLMTTLTLDYFTSLVAEDESLPLTEAALALAQDAYPDLDLQGSLAEIDELVVRVRRRIPEDADV